MAKVNCMDGVQRNFSSSWLGFQSWRYLLSFRFSKLCKAFLLGLESIRECIAFYGFKGEARKPFKELKVIIYAFIFSSNARSQLRNPAWRSGWSSAPPPPSKESDAINGQLQPVSVHRQREEIRYERMHQRLRKFENLLDPLACKKPLGQPDRPTSSSKVRLPCLKMTGQD